MSYPVKLELYQNGYMISELIARNEDDLNCRIEMDTGIGWLDAVPLYQAMVAKGCDQVSEVFKVCHSYEKWGSMQQEVKKIKVIIKGI